MKEEHREGFYRDPDGNWQPERRTAVDRRLDAAQLKARVEATLARINPRYRRALELRFLQGVSRPECAERLEVRLGTFDVLLLRALRAFRREWTEAPAAAAGEE